MSLANNHLNQPTVSVIIPTFNRPGLLKRAIESVLSQDYENIIEIIITDDGSSEETKKVVEEFLKKDKRIIYVKNTKYPKGPCGNKNNGLDYASGEFLVILDDDDELLPNAISTTIKAYIEYGYKIILAACIDSKEKKFTGKHYNNDEVVTYKDFLCGKYEGEYFLVIHRDLIGEKRFYSEAYGGESLLWWEAFKEAKAFYIHKPLRIYNVENPFRVTFNVYKHPKRTFLIYKLMLELYGEDMKRLCPKVYIKNCFMASLFARLSGEYLKAIKYSLMTFKVKRLSFLKLLFLVFIILPLPKRIFIAIREFSQRYIKNLLFKSI
ncbi:MAG: glycosyltransferase [Candidatus Omnitrophica bacterium]|nr:glycosyltransferase [Candidatus Omnitrophota bacterium]